MDFFSKVRKIRKLCDNNIVLDKVLYLLGRLMTAKSEGMTQKKLSSHLKDLIEDIREYLTIHRKYMPLKS
jgi:hypothetical protein